MDKIGIFKGRGISEMTREELLEFAEWAAKEIVFLQKIAEESLDLRIKKEIFKK